MASVIILNGGMGVGKTTIALKIIREYNQIKTKLISTDQIIKNFKEKYSNFKKYTPNNLELNKIIYKHAAEILENCIQNQIEFIVIDRGLHFISNNIFEEICDQNKIKIYKFMLILSESESIKRVKLRSNED